MATNPLPLFCSKTPTHHHHHFHHLHSLHHSKKQQPFLLLFHHSAAPTKSSLLSHYYDSASASAPLIRINKCRATQVSVAPTHHHRHFHHLHSLHHNKKQQPFLLLFHHSAAPNKSPLFSHYYDSASASAPVIRIGKCRATQVSVAKEEEDSANSSTWVPVVPLAALPKGERRVIIQDGEDILLLWYKDQVFAIENRSPAEGAYSEGLLNAKLTQDGCIVCPTTDSTFDLRTGEIKEWYPKNPVLRVLTPALRNLYIYSVKTDEQNIYISISGGVKSDASAEIVFSGKAQPGVTASDVNVDEVRMVVDESQEGFGFSKRNEIINGKAAVIGFLLLLDFELLTGKGLLKGTGFLDFLYSVSNTLN